MGLLKILFFPVVIAWRLIVVIIRFVLITNLVITAVFMLVLAAVAYLFYKGDTEMLRRFLNLFVAHRGD